jgi:hypothetical protein
MGATPGRLAARRVEQQHSLHVTLPRLGRINLGSPEQLAYLAGIAVLAALEIVEWPVACIIAVGHILADQRRSATLRLIGNSA